MLTRSGLAQRPFQAVPSPAGAPGFTGRRLAFPQLALRQLALPRLACGALLLLLVMAGDAPRVMAQEDANKTPADGAKKAPAPAPILVVPEQFNSPRATLRTFLQAINQQEDTPWDLVKRSMDLSKVNPERFKDIAGDLLSVMNRTDFVEYSNLPDAAAVRANKTTSFNYFPGTRFVEIQQNLGTGEVITLAVMTEGKHRGYWKFTAETVAGASKLRRELAQAGYEEIYGERRGDSLTAGLWLRSQFPAWAQNGEWLTVAYWQWFSLLIFIAMGVLVDHLVRLILRTIAKAVIKRQKGEASREGITRVVRPLGLLCAGLFWLGTMHLLALGDAATTVVYAAIRVFTVLAGTWAAWRLADLVGEVMDSKARLTRTRFDDVLVPLVRKIIKVFIIAFGLIYGAVSLNINIMPMLTGLGIGGLAFAFAAKDTIENFFGSIAVITDRAFEVGDWVVIDDVEGTVETVGFRSTRVRTFYNSLVVVPNAKLVRAVVDNYGKRKYRRWKTHIGVQYDTSPDQLLAFTEGIREIVRTHPYTRKDYFQVWLHQFSASSLDVLLYIFWETPDWSTELRERERLSLDIMRLAEQLGVQFAFPTQTVHLHTADQAAEPDGSPDVPTSMSDRRAMVTGIRAAQKLMKRQPWQDETPGPVEYRQGPTALEDDDASVEGDGQGEAAGDGPDNFIEDTRAGS